MPPKTTPTQLDTSFLPSLTRALRLAEACSRYAYKFSWVMYADTEHRIPYSYVAMGSVKIHCW